MNAADLIGRLTDVYDKRPDSNIGKLLSILADQFTKIEQTIALIQAWRDIDAAEGSTLDRIGENVVQDRGSATDEVYRVLIKTKIARNLSTADINTIIRIISVAVGAPFSDIEIKPQFNDPIDPEPAALSLLRLPLDRVNQSGVSLTQFSRIIQRTVAAGVRVQNVELQGTFELGDLPLIQDAAAGLGDVNNPAIGGYLGAVFEPGSDSDLPL
jgi:hypothetical protein